tara:strand:- start:47 stop:595 length:549 start_codon:yes stop_codon:yes gene_type:complete
MREIIIRYAEKGEKWTVPLTTADRVARYAFDALELQEGAPDRESLIVVPVDPSYYPVGFVRVEGTTDAVICPPETVLGTPLRMGVTRFFMAHVHPDGNVAPSDDDIITTHQIRQGAQLVGLHCCGHVVIGSNGHYHSILTHTRGTLDLDAMKAGHQTDLTPQIEVVSAIELQAERFSMLELD